jgi:hypothetical protein
MYPSDNLEERDENLDITATRKQEILGQSVLMTNIVHYSPLAGFTIDLDY